MKNLLALLCFLFLVKNTKAQTDFVDYVNQLMGTDSDFSLSNGNTYPAIALPWGMNFWTPQTAKMGDGWAYAYDARYIQGFKQTHQPSPWINDYAAFSLMPVTGEVKFEAEDCKSWFSHKAETVKPHYYKTYLADYDLVTEITPTERAVQFRFTFPESEQSHIVIDGFNKGSMVKIFPKERKIIGYCGDEDNRQTTAWYVFSALGFYPVCPGTTQYVFGSPLFDKVTMTFENGNIFEIEANNNNKNNVYINSARLNGKAYSKTWIDHHDLQNGGQLKFEMQKTPNKQWASDKAAVSYSMSKE